MYIDEIRSMSTDEVLDKIEDLKVEMYTYRLQKDTGELKDTTLFRKTRRDIARLKTALRERELAAEMISQRGAGCLTIASVWWEQSSATRWKRLSSSPSRIARCTRYITKWCRRRRKVMAHDETGAGIGALVQIVQSRPLSKRKRWVVETVLEAAQDLAD